MNLLCPHCQKMLQVPDQQAGQRMNCPLCGNAFAVPSLPQSAPPPGPAAPPAGSVQVTAAPGTAPPPAAAAGRPEVYTFAPEPPATTPPAPWHDVAKLDASAPSRAAPAPPPPAPPAGYRHTRTLWISPRVVPWIAPVCLVIVFILLFFTWVGMYPGGIPVFTQNAWEGITGGSWYDRVFWGKIPDSEALRSGEREPIHPGWSVLMLFYVLCVLAAFVVAVACLVLPWVTITIPPAVQRLWPWRTVLLGLLALVALVLLLVQVVAGFPVERKVNQVIAARYEPRHKANETDEDKRIIDLEEGLERDKFHLARSTALYLAFLLEILAVIGVGLDLWLERRGPNRPLPRVDFLR